MTVPTNYDASERGDSLCPVCGAEVPGEPVLIHATEARLREIIRQVLLEVQHEQYGQPQLARPTYTAALTTNTLNNTATTPYTILW